jgi:two-component system, chemotaxis family, CheB/CheR fusion protein
MPHSAIASGCVDYVLAPDQIAREIIRIGQHPYAAPPPESRQPEREPDLAQVVQLLKRVTGVDFTHYKFNTLYRRITRRMVLRKLEGMSQYVQFLRQTPAEVQALYQDILISVTSFFRDPASFEALKSQVFPLLLKDRAQHDPVRVWTLGCSTGQEAYSIAMAFIECVEAAGSQVQLQLFATDLSLAGIEKARAGFYSKDIAQDVSPERLRQFFTEVDGGYRIRKTIRDACIFSRHNVLADPPFSRIDLISCRNLLIYLEPVLQQQIVPTLHYALKPMGYLWLGGSETIGSFRNLFDVRDARHKIYSKNLASGPGPGHFPLQHGDTPRAPFVPLAARSSEAADLPREADRLLLTRFVPPSVLVSADLDILQYRGDTGPYLAPTPGKASLSLLKMLREGLLVAVRAAILRAKKEQAVVREEGLRVNSNGGYHEVAIEVIPLKGHGPQDGGFLILFEDAQTSRERPRAETKTHSAGEAPGTPDADSTRLIQELAATRAYLQSVIEQQEAANEELQSANEEVQSANEELQSTNEELETSKEEIESSNEELATVNGELNNRNTELNRLNNDLVNLIESGQMPIVMLGRDLCIRRFTPAAQKLFNLTPADMGRPLTDMKLVLDNLPDLGSVLTEVLETGRILEREVQDKKGRWCSWRLRPYKTLENMTDGVVVTLIDVDTLKRAQAYSESIVATVREPLVMLDKDLRVRTASRAFYECFRATPEDTENRLLYELGNGQWNILQLRRLLEEVLTRDQQVDDFQLEYQAKNTGPRKLLLNARRLLQAGDQAPLILLAIEDVTTRDSAEKVLRASEQRLRALFDLGPVAVYSCDVSGVIKEFNRRAAELWGRTPAQGDTDERFCGSYKMRLPDGTFIPHESCPMADVLSGKIPAAHDVEVIIERPDGSQIAVVVNIVPLTNERGETIGAINCFYDITERKQAAERLQQYADHLSESDHRKNEFLAMLAHELRNPLAPIRNALQILRQTGDCGEVVHSAAAILERQVGQMVRLVDDLLDVSRISRGKIGLRLARIELASTMHHAVEAARPLAQSKDLDLSVTFPPEPLYLNADPVRLAQIVGNLLNNACKFTDDGGRIWLTAEREGDQVVIRVQDSGVGIAADQLPHIFEMFMQIDSSLERSVTGLGIGLALVKNLVQLHGGTVEVHSAGVGKGSEFVVRLPIVLEAPASLPPDRAVGEVAPTVARRILVVDDNRDSADSLVQLLKLTGNETQTAYDGLEAEAAAETFRPDVVLLDLGLPKLNGHEVCRRIRAQPWGKNMIVVALTGWGQDEDRQKSKEAGFSGHMVKPVELKTLHALLTRLSAGL